MKKILLTTTLIYFFLISNGKTDIITSIVVLDKKEQQILKQQINSNAHIAKLYTEIKSEADNCLNDIPLPLDIIHYEGLLDTNPKRIKTVESLQDINKIVLLIYAGYGTIDIRYSNKVKEYVLAWVNAYKPTGNPINENKLTPIFWGYYLNRSLFDEEEKIQVEDWIYRIAVKEKNRINTPNNNWQAKRLKITGIAGCILNDTVLQKFALQGLKTFISTSYYPDGTSHDLKQRDALHYHLGGIKPLLNIFINLQKFNTDFDLFAAEDGSGVSVKKSVEYTVPFATGKKVHKEWVNTKVELDKQRAAAGIEKYQPGQFFEPSKAIPMFEWAVFYNPDWFSIVCENKHIYTCSWIGFLNSPIIRN